MNSKLLTRCLTTGASRGVREVHRQLLMSRQKAERKRCNRLTGSVADFVDGHGVEVAMQVPIVELSRAKAAGAHQFQFSRGWVTRPSHLSPVERVLGALERVHVGNVLLVLDDTDSSDVTCWNHIGVHGRYDQTKVGDVPENEEEKDSRGERERARQLARSVKRERKTR